jgi:hypothetical protein
MSDIIGVIRALCAEADSATAGGVPSAGPDVPGICGNTRWRRIRSETGALIAVSASIEHNVIAQDIQKSRAFMMQ